MIPTFIFLQIWQHGRYHFNSYKLLHALFDGKSLTMEEAKTAHYYLQRDVAKDQSPCKHLEYIVKHDEAKNWII